MSNFTVNRNGLDQVTLQFMTTGRNECSVSLREALLDEKLEYVFSVDHLNVPLDAVPITNNKTDVELFRVIRRNVGASLNEVAAIQLDPAVWVGADIYTLNQRFYDVSSFVKSINNWARGVELKIALEGHMDLRQLGALANSDVAAPPPPLRLLAPRTNLQIFGGENAVGVGTYDMIKFLLSVDGTLDLKMSHDFVNNYVLQFSRYGAEILGLNNKISTVNQQKVTVDAQGANVVGAAKNYYYLAVTRVDEQNVSVLKFDAASWVDNTAQHIIRQLAQGGGQNNREVEIYSEHSLYQVLDQRVKISINSHLPMLNNMFVKEGKESVSRSIVEVFFDNKVVSSVSFDEDGVYKESKITNTLYAGQYPLIKKSDRSKQWHKLLTSFSLRFLRFSIWVTYRNYVSAKDEWTFETIRLPIDDTQFWDFSLRFLSLV